MDFRKNKSPNRRRMYWNQNESEIFQNSKKNEYCANSLEKERFLKINQENSYQSTKNQIKKRNNYDCELTHSNSNELPFGTESAKKLPINKNSEYFYIDHSGNLKITINTIKQEKNSNKRILNRHRNRRATTKDNNNPKVLSPVLL